MKYLLTALLLSLADSATLKQDTNSLQPLQSMIQLFGDSVDFMLRDATRMVIQQLYPEQADARLAQLLGCDGTLWGNILPEILSDDLERLTATCQDTNRTILLNTMLQDIMQGLANSSDPCIAFYARFQADVGSYLNSATTQGWRLDLGWTSSGQQYSVPIDTVVNNLPRLPGFLDPTDSTTVELTDDITTLTRDVLDTEREDEDDFASIVDSSINVSINNSNQQLLQALIQFLSEAASLLCSITRPVSIDSPGSNS